MSEDSRNIVKCVARVWRLIKKQQELFRLLMGLNIPATLRKTCSNGYMISLLYKKEIGELYESVKCNLNDGDLASITASKNDQEAQEENLIKLLSQLIEQQKRLIHAYEELHLHLDEGSEADMACSRHREELTDFCQALSEELAASAPADADIQYPSVA
jgi:hypothetical protein